MNSNPPLISIILPVYKEPMEYIKESLTSLINQTYKNLEIIVIVDNPEHSEAITLMQEAQLKNSNIRLHINQSNVGLIKTLNTGISLANGEFIARMDSDDVSFPDRLEKQYTYLNDNSLDIVGGFAEKITPNSRSIGTWIMPTSKIGISFFTRYHTPILHPTWLCKKAVLIECKGYREIKYAEDHDLLARALLSGYKLGNVPSKVIKYRVNPDSVSNLNSQWAYWARVFIGRMYKQNRLKMITDAEYNSYIKYKLKSETSDPRLVYMELRRSIREREVGIFLKKLIFLITSTPSFFLRIKNKTMIQCILKLDRLFN